MALGGGTFTSQNKELPGAYINFVSAASASAALSDRGIATMPLELDWGVEGEVFEVTNEDFQKNSLKLFGYAFDSPKMLGLNDLFMGAKTLYAYRLNGGGDKAANTYATAKYCGVRGNDLKIVIQKNADDASKYDVTTYFGTVKVDTQTVAKAADLVANDYVTFKTADLAVTAGTPLTGGTWIKSNHTPTTLWALWLLMILPRSYMWLSTSVCVMNLVSSSSWLFITCLLIIWALSV